MSSKKRSSKVESDDEHMSENEDNRSEDEAIKSDNEDEDSMNVEKKEDTKSMKIDDMFKVNRNKDLFDIFNRERRHPAQNPRKLNLPMCKSLLIQLQISPRIFLGSKNTDHPISMTWFLKATSYPLVSHISISNSNFIVRKLIEANKLPHLLFYGPPGTGKTSTILAIARLLYGKHFSSMILEVRIPNSIQKSNHR